MNCIWVKNCPCLAGEVPVKKVGHIEPLDISDAEKIFPHEPRFMREDIVGR
jgi:hypothetical protein